MDKKQAFAVWWGKNTNLPGVKRKRGIGSFEISFKEKNVF
jgi:hypothetical protein